MKTPYRITSVVALATLSLAIVSVFLPPPSPKLTPRADGAVSWDPCVMWVQYAPMEKMTLYVCFGSFVFFVARGLRNRSGPRWLAIVGVLALTLGVASGWWRIAGGCYTAASLAFSFTWFGAVALMFLHHTVQPRGATQALLHGGRLRALAYQGVLPLFVAMPVAWSILNQFTVRSYVRGEPQSAYAAVRAVQGYTGWAELVLFPFAAAVGLHWLITRTPKRDPKAIGNCGAKSGIC